MPTRLAATVLTVDAGKMHKIDTSNVENLFGMWTVFNRCAESMEEGRRLENLSWRLWNRETLCCDSKPRFPDTPTSTTPTQRFHQKGDMPELSTSVDSVSSDSSNTIPRLSVSPPVHLTGLSSRKVSPENLSSSRGGAKPTSSLVLEKIVINIKETKITEYAGITNLSSSITDALPSVSPRLRPAPTSHQPHQSSKQLTTRSSELRRESEQHTSHSSTSTAPTSSPESVGGAVARSQTSDSTTSAELITPHSIVRGFTPTRISSSFRNHSSIPLSSPPSIKPATMHIEQKEADPKGVNFMLGGSSDDESSFGDHKSLKPVQSSLTSGLKRVSTEKKITSFKDEVESRTIANRAVEDEGVWEDDSDEEDDDVEDDDEEDESAIDDEDEEWEDDATEDGESSVADNQLFKRVDSKPNLVSRRSLITTMMHQSERASALAGMATKSQPSLSHQRTSPPSGPVSGSLEEEEEEEDDSALELPTSNIPRSKSKPIIMTTSNTHPPALSPRTTRRNMLSTELTESLRKNLLWERQQKSSTANAVLKRRHTAHDMANLKTYPTVRSGTNSKNNSWNNYFDQGLGEYNSKGW